AIRISRGCSAFRRRGRRCSSTARSNAVSTNTGWCRAATGRMTAESALRLALVPAVVGVASLAARRWGHAVSGYLGGLPLIGGPITFYLALDYGTEFAARSAMFTLAAILGQAAHLLAFAHSSRRRSWALSLAAGWSAFAVVSISLAALPITPIIALGIAPPGLAPPWRFLPRAAAPA